MTLTPRNLRDRLHALMGTTIAEPIQAKLGNPVNRLVPVPEDETDIIGAVYIHGLELEPNAVSIVRNTVLRPEELIYDAPVELELDSATHFRIKGRNTTEWQSFMAGVHISDQKLTGVDQITWGILQPTNPVSMAFVVEAAVYTLDGTRYAVARQVGADQTANIPATPGQAVAVHVKIDPTTGTLSYTVSSAFSGALGHKAALAAGLYPVSIGAALFSLGWVVLLYGMTAINPGRNIYNAPEWLWKSSSSANFNDILTSEGRVLVDNDGNVMTAD